MLIINHKYVMQYKTWSDPVVRLQKPGIPEECQQQIYDQFGISINGLPTSKIVVDQASTL